jgi:hypothetical protein
MVGSSQFDGPAALTPIPIEMEAGRPLELAIHPVACRYTYWAIPIPHNTCYTNNNKEISGEIIQPTLLWQRLLDIQIFVVNVKFL